MWIDAHTHLWDVQCGSVEGRRVRALTGGRSDFGGETVQMMPPYMLDGRNTAQMLLSNMDYAGVSGAVVTQEEIDGNQDDYLLECRREAGGRLKVCSLYTEGGAVRTDGFDGVKICAGRLRTGDLTRHMDAFRAIDRAGLFLSIDLADGDAQTAQLLEIVRELPGLRVAIGHFGMVTRPKWTEQIKLAREKNVFIESGGITWLFHREFYPYPSAIRAMREAAELVSWEKLMWGSDYPRTMTAITYAMSLDFVVHSKELTPEQKNLFLGENARKFYRFDPISVPVHIKNMVE